MRKFNGSTDHITASSTFVMPAAYSWFMWYENDSAPGTSITQPAIISGDSDVPAEVGWSWGHASATYRSAVYHRAETGAFPVADLGGLSANTRYAVGATYGASTLKAYLDGANTATTGSAAAPADENMTIDLGRNGLSGGNSYDDGQIAEFAFWSVVLTDAEMAALASGVSPAFIRPSKILAYWPLAGGPLRRMGVDGTVTGTTLVAHPRIVYPVSPSIVYVPAGGGAGSVTASADSLLTKAFTQSASINALLVQQDLVRQSSADALLTRAATVSAAINALLTASQTTTSSIDAILAGAGASIDAFADALLLKARTGTVSADSLLQVAQSVVVSADSLILKAATVSGTIDALLLKAGSVATSIDAILVAPGSNIVTASVDSLLTARLSISAVADALISTSGSLTLSADAYIDKAQSVVAGLDAVLRAVGQTVSVSLDAILTGETQLGHIVATITIEPAIGATISTQPAIDAGITIN